MSYRFIISGGGTGGHIYPAVAIAGALDRLAPGSEFLFVGANGRMEMTKVPQAGYEIKGLDIAGINRSNILKNISLPYKILKSLRDARKIIDDFRPDAVIGTGGYASFPVLSSGQRQGVKSFIQEQNAFAGKANQRLGKKANNIFTAFDDMSEFFDPYKTLNYGNPIRKSIYENLPSRDEAVLFFGLNPEKPVLSIVGGSLGARSINQQITKILPNLVDEGVQVVWQTGETYLKAAQEAAQDMDEVRVMDFLPEIQNLYRAADLVISRAGASAIAELAVMARPVIFVPLPTAAEDHQRHNAQRLVENDAAAMILDVDMETNLFPEIQNLLGSPATRDQYSKNINEMAVLDADQKIAQKILDIIDEHQ